MSFSTKEKIDQWDQRIKEFREFKEAHGHFAVPRSVEKYKQLSDWMIDNQAHYNKIRKGESSSRLTSERLIQLMDLGFTFSSPTPTGQARTINKEPTVCRCQINGNSSKFDKQWNLRVRELEAFKKEKGHFDIPHNNNHYKQLYRWKKRIQGEYNKLQGGVKSKTLTEQRLAQLESIGFKFNATWNFRVKELEAFNKENGHFRIPKNEWKYKQLRGWMASNQTEYNNIQKGIKSRRLTEERLAQLESIGYHFVDTSMNREERESKTQEGVCRQEEGEERTLPGGQSLDGKPYEVQMRHDSSEEASRKSYSGMEVDETCNHEGSCARQSETASVPQPESECWFDI